MASLPDLHCSETMLETHLHRCNRSQTTTQARSSTYLSTFAIRECYSVPDFLESEPQTPEQTPTGRSSCFQQDVSGVQKRMSVSGKANPKLRRVERRGKRGSSSHGQPASSSKSVLGSSLSRRTATLVSHSFTRCSAGSPSGWNVRHALPGLRNIRPVNAGGAPSSSCSSNGSPCMGCAATSLFCYFF